MAKKRKTTASTVKRYVKAHGFILPHGYEIRKAKKRATKKRK